MAAGLPQAKLLCQSAGQYAERFSYPRVVAFTRDEAIRAFRETARLNNGDFTPEAAARGYDLTEGYPHFIQVYGELAWIHGKDDPISLRDVEAINPLAKTVREGRCHSGGPLLRATRRLDVWHAAPRAGVRAWARSLRLTAPPSQGPGWRLRPLPDEGGTRR